MNYNDRVACTYVSDDVFCEEEDAGLSDADREFVRGVVYRQELLDIFDAASIDELSGKTHLLFASLRTHPAFVSCMKAHALPLVPRGDPAEMLDAEESNLESGLMVLYSFDFMHLVHPCVCDWIRNQGRLSQASLDALQHIEALALAPDSPEQRFV